MPQLDALLHGVVEHDRVEQVSVELLGPTGFLVHIVAAVTQEPELVRRDASHFLEHVFRNDPVEILQFGVLVAVGHEERWNRTGEATQVVADDALDGLLLLFPFWRFRPHARWSRRPI